LLVEGKSFGGAGDKLLASLNPFEKTVNQAVKNGIARRLLHFPTSRYLFSEHTVVKRLIWDKHVRHCHAGVQLLLYLVRQYSRILERPRIFKSAISKCVRCRCFEGRKSDPVVFPSPADRLIEVSVFKIYVPNLWGGCS
jgi:hypothetical protein